MFAPITKVKGSQIHLALSTLEVTYSSVEKLSKALLQTTDSIVIYYMYNTISMFITLPYQIQPMPIN
jgi:hypothetical protein